MKYIDLTGKTFNRLTVIGYAGRDGGGRSLWRCRCDCGNEKITKASYLKNGNVKSCGCASIEQRRAAGQSRSHPLSRANKPAGRRCWQNMIARCTDPNNRGWHQYGGRGITVCDRWLESFANFFEDMGDPAKGMTLDRIDSDGHYAPDNCRWATQKEQANNRRNNRLVTINGVTLTMTQWTEKVGISSRTVESRLRIGWTEERAITEPVRHR